MCDYGSTSACSDSTDVSLPQFLVQHPRKHFLPQNKKVRGERVPLPKPFVQFEALRFTSIYKDFKGYQRYVAKNPI